MTTRTSGPLFLRTSVLIVGVVFCLGAEAQPTDSFWTNASNDGSWFNVANWTNGIPDGPGDTATIRTNSSAINGPVLTLDATIGELNFVYRGSRAELSGDDTLTFDQPGEAPAAIQLGRSRSPYQVTIGVPIAIADDETLDIFTNINGSLRLDGPIVSTGGDLVKLGSQELTLTAASPAWGGELSIASGEVFVEGVNSLGNAAGATTIASGATLHLGAESVEPLRLIGGVVNFTENGVSRNPIELVGEGILRQSPGGFSIPMTGSVSGAGTLHLEMERAFLRGDSSYTGETEIAQGTYFVESATALGSPTMGTIVQSLSSVTFWHSVDEPLDIRGGQVGFSPGIVTTGDIRISSGELTLSDAIWNTAIDWQNEGGMPILRGSPGSRLRGGITGIGDLSIGGVLDIDEQPLSHDGGLRVIDGPNFSNPGVELNVANTYTGDTIIEKGILYANHPQALGVASTPVIVKDQLVLNASIDRDFEIAGSFIVPTPGHQFDGNLTLGILGDESGDISGEGMFNGEIFMNGAQVPGLRVGLSGVFNGVISGEARKLTLGGNAIINSNNTYRGITFLGSGVAEVNAPAGLGFSDQGTYVERGSVQLNVATEEPIVVAEEGRVDVNTQQVHLPRLMGLERNLPPRSHVLAINHAGVYDESVDVVEGTLEVNANTTLDGAVVREQGQLRIADGATLNLAGSELELRSGSVSGRVASVPRIRKTTGYEARLGNLPGYDGEINVERGSLIVTSPGSLGTTAGGTRLAGGDTVLQFNVPDDETFAEDIDLNNSLGNGSLPGMYIRRFSFSHPVILLKGTLDLGDQGSSIGGPDSRSTSDTVTFELAGSVVGGDLITQGRKFITRVVTPDANHTGITDIRQGTIELSGSGRLAATEKIVLHEAPDFFDGRLDLNNRDVKIDDRIHEATPIEFLGGALVSNGELDETVGTLGFKEGDSMIDLFPSSTERTFDKRLNIARLERKAGAVATVHVSSTAQAHVNQQPNLANGILPWMLAIDHRSSSDRQMGFAVFTERGIVPVSDYQTDFQAANASSNMLLTRATVLASDTHVNSLTAANSSAEIDLNGNLLTVESGGVLSVGITSGQITAGAAGNYELVVPRSTNISASIIDNGENAVSVTVNGALSGSNSYSGTTYVNEGTAVFTSSRSLPADTNLNVSGGTVELDFGTGVPKKLKNIRIAEGGSLESDFRDRIALDFEELLLEEGSFGKVAIVGDGTIRKTTPGSVSLTVERSSTFSGDILVEDGYLETVAFEANPRFIVRGGMLGLVAAGNSTIELAGGDLRVGDSFFNSIVNFPEGVINVSKASRIVIQGSIKPQAVISHPIIGAGDLTFTGRAVTATSNSSTEQPRAHRVRINTGNPEYSGDVMIDTITVSVGDSTSLGSGEISIGPAGRLELDSGYDENVSIQNALYLSGGEIRGYAKGFEQQIVGPIHISRDARIGGVEVLGPLFLQDESRLTVIGDTLTQLEGDLFIGSYVELEYGTTLINRDDASTENGATHLTGTIIADASDAVLNLIDRGLDELVFEVNLEASLGKSLTLLKDGKRMRTELSGAGNGVTGDGTIGADVNLSGGATISPGASPGKLTIDGATTIGPDAVYEWELDDIVGGAGVASDLLQVEGILEFTATPDAPWVFEINELNDALVFEDSEWLVAVADEIAGFDPAAVEIVASNVNSTFQKSMGDRFAIEARGNQLFLTLTVPEPPSLVMLCCVGVVGLAFHRLWLRK